MRRPCSLFLLYVVQCFLCKVSPVVFLFTAVICQNPPKFTVSVGKSSIFDLAFVQLNNFLYTLSAVFVFILEGFGLWCFVMFSIFLKSR